MASWLSAQLKAAEGLLEAVDKSVSKTVGTLGLAEGEDDFQGEYGVPQPSSTSHQPQAGSAAAPLYPQSHSQPAASQPPYAYTPPTATSYAPGAWDYSRTATGPVGAVGSTTTASIYGSHVATAAATSAGSGNGVAGGFTVRADGPIPFGSKPPPPPSSGSFVTGMSPSSSQTAIAGADGGNGGGGGSTSISNSTAAWGAAATAPAPLAGSAVSWTPAANSATSTPAITFTSTTMPLYGTAPGASSAASAAPLHPNAAPISGVSVGFGAPAAGAAPKEPAPAGEDVHGLGPTPAATNSSFAAVTPVKPAAPMGSTAASTHEPMPSTTTSTAAAAPAPSFLRAGSSGADAAATGTTPAATGPRSSSTGEPPAAAAAVAPKPALAATAPTAAAAALASATAAVSHSLSFFNLVMDDPETSAASASAGGGGGGSGGGGGGPFPADGGAAAAQVQSLTRTVEQLRKRLDSSRQENEQLEDMMARAEVNAQQQAALVSSLREELSGLKQGRATSESSLSAQLSVARANLAEVSGRYEASQRSVLVLEGQLAALEESSRRLMEQHSDREGGMVDALRAELSSAESRLAAERKAHHASRAAAASRESDLEAQISGGTAALADLTRALEEANRKGRALEDEVVTATRSRNDLAAQVASLQRQLADAGIDEEDAVEGDGRLRSPGHGGKGVAAAAAAAELEVLRGELSHHRRAADLAKQAAESSQSQVAAMAEELEALRLSAEQRKDTTQLEAQLREMSDMLYLKQTQLERLAAEKAAQQLQTERELDRVRQELAKLTRATVGQGGGGGMAGGLPTSSGSSSGSSHDVIPMDALGEPYQRLARNNKVGKAVKAAANFLDSTASTTSYVLRQYPLARLAVFAYVLLIHLYVYLLTARMQRLATHWEAVASAPVVG